jgi:hypothetical protein
MAPPEADSSQNKKPQTICFSNLPTLCYMGKLFEYSSTAKAIEAYKEGKRTIKGQPILCQILEMSFCTNLGSGFEEPIERNFPNLHQFTPEDYRAFANAEKEVRTQTGLCLLLSKKEESIYQIVQEPADTASRVDVRTVSYRLDLKPKKPWWTLFR